MDNSGQTLHTDKVFEKQLAEMSNCAPEPSNDPSFDWQGFKEFLLDENNFELILNALQQGANAQSVPNQQQYFYDSTKQAPKANFGGQCAVRPFTNGPDPWRPSPQYGVRVPQPSMVGQYGVRVPQPSMVGQYGVRVPQPSMVGQYAVRAPQPSMVGQYAVRAPQPSMVGQYAVRAPQPSMVGKYAVRAPQPSMVGQYAVRAPQPSMVGKYAVPPGTYLNRAPVFTKTRGPAAPGSFIASAPQKTVYKSRTTRKLPVGPYVCIKNSPKGFKLCLKEQRPLVKPELKIPESRAYLGAMYSNHDVFSGGVSPATSTSSATSTVNQSQKNGSASLARPQVYIKKPPNAFILFLKEQRPFVKPGLKVTGSKGVLTYLGAAWKSLPKHLKEKYYEEAERQKLLHKEKNPGWSTKDNYGKRLTKAGKRRLVKNSGT